MKKILLIFLAFITTKIYAQNCELIAKYGIYDTKTINLSRERAISFLKLFKRDVNMTYQEAKDYSATIGIPIEGVLVELGLTASEDSYRKYVESVQAMTIFDEYYIEKIQIVNRTVNKDIAQILKDCYSQDGIHTRIENTEDDDIYYLTILFKWNGNHDPVKLKLSWEANKDDLSLNGIKYNKSYPFIINNGEEKKIAVKRNKNIAIPFALNLNGRNTVKVHSGTLTIYKTKVFSTPPVSSIKFVELKAQTLSRTPTALHVGDGDEELKLWSTTHLKDGKFSLGLETDTTLVADLTATIKEENHDWTEFRLSNKYFIYKAPKGYKIIGFKIQDGQGFISSFDAWQSVWVKPELVSSGPLSSYIWQGDSGRTQDQIEGCWVQPVLKTIIVMLDKK